MNSYSPAGLLLPARPGSVSPSRHACVRIFSKFNAEPIMGVVLAAKKKQKNKLIIYFFSIELFCYCCNFVDLLDYLVSGVVRGGFCGSNLLMPTDL